MKKFCLALAAVALFAFAFHASRAEAHGRRVVVGPYAYRTTVVRPILPVFRPRVVVTTAAVPVAVTANYLAPPVVLIPQSPYWGYVPTTVSYGPVGTRTYVGW